MLFYKCEDCGLLISELIPICPKCNSTKTMKSTDTDSIEEVVFKLTMVDVDSVIEDMDEEDQEKINEECRDTIQNILHRKMEIPWTEYIESTLKAKFL